MGIIGFFVKLVFIVSENDGRLGSRERGAHAAWRKHKQIAHLFSPTHTHTQTQPINQIIVGGGQAKQE